MQSRFIMLTIRKETIPGRTCRQELRIQPQLHPNQLNHKGNTIEHQGFSIASLGKAKVFNSKYTIMKHKPASGGIVRRGLK